MKVAQPSNMQDLNEESKTGENPTSAAAVDESHCNLKDDDETLETFSERKPNTNPLPALKGNKNAMTAGNKVKAFSQRILNGSLQLDPTDIHGIAN